MWLVSKKFILKFISYLYISVSSKHVNASRRLVLVTCLAVIGFSVFQIGRFYIQGGKKMDPKGSFNTNSSKELDMKIWQ